MSSSCYLGASLEDVETIGWAGHHEYRLTLSLVRWLPRSVVTMRFAQQRVRLLTRPNEATAYRFQQSGTSSVDALLGHPPDDYSITAHIVLTSPYAEPDPMALELSCTGSFPPSPLPPLPPPQPPIPPPPGPIQPPTVPPMPPITPPASPPAGPPPSPP
eukprot:4058711-Prymnesium_polylepis.1